MIQSVVFAFYYGLGPLGKQSLSASGDDHASMRVPSHADSMRPMGRPYFRYNLRPNIQQSPDMAATLSGRTQSNYMTPWHQCWIITWSGQPPRLLNVDHFVVRDVGVRFPREEDADIRVVDGIRDLLPSVIHLKQTVDS
jgi:hypothetical protein